MDRAALNELFDFTTFTWETYRRAAKNLPDGELNRPLEGSGWASLRQPLAHIAGAWDGWLSEKAGDVFTEFDIDGIVTWDGLQTIREQTRTWMRRILDEFTDVDLFEKTEPTWDAQPDASRSTAADVILHILLHERGHHGDITTLLSQTGADVGNSDYLIYRFFKSRRKT